jgi:hypothetical protein
VIGGWRKLHNEEFHNLYSSSNVVRMIKSKRAGHVAQMGGGLSTSRGYWWEGQNERDC